MQEKHQRPALYSPEWWLVWKKGIADQKRAKDKEQVPIVEAVIRRHYPAQVAPTTAGSSSTVGGAARAARTTTGSASSSSLFSAGSNAGATQTRRLDSSIYQSIQEGLYPLSSVELHSLPPPSENLFPSRPTSSSSVHFSMRKEQNIPLSRAPSRGESSLNSRSGIESRGSTLSMYTDTDSLDGERKEWDKWDYNMHPSWETSTIARGGRRRVNHVHFGHTKARTAAAADTGNYSDYLGQTSCLGKQASSQKLTEMLGGSFSQASRLPKSRKAVGGQRAYDSHPSSFGMQSLSNCKSAPNLSFGSSRAQVDKAFTHSRAPGPIYDPKMPVPKRYHSQAKSFGTRLSAIAQRERVGYYNPKQYVGAEGPFVKFRPLSFEEEQKEKEKAEMKEDLDTEDFVGFGFGCNEREHLLYGRCIDGKCSSRSNWEKTNGLRAAGTKRRGRVKKRAAARERILAKAHGEIVEEDPDAKRKVATSKKAEASPLHHAAALNEPTVMKKLLQGSMVWNPARQELVRQGIDINGRDEKGQTPLHIASQNGSIRIVNILLAAGNSQDPAKVNLIDRRGRTPLHYAAENGYHKVVLILLKNGANADIQDKRGDVPTDVCRNDRNGHTAFQLIKEGAMIGDLGNILHHMRKEKETKLKRINDRIIQDNISREKTRGSTRGSMRSNLSRGSSINRNSRSRNRSDSYSGAKTVSF